MRHKDYLSTDLSDVLEGCYDEEWDVAELYDQELRHRISWQIVHFSVLPDYRQGEGTAMPEEEYTWLALGLVPVADDDDVWMCRQYAALDPAGAVYVPKYPHYGRFA